MHRTPAVMLLCPDEKHTKCNLAEPNRIHARTEEHERGFQMPEQGMLLRSMNVNTTQ